MALSQLAKKYLRGLGHHLDPVVNIGKEGIDEGLVKATAVALKTHELIKIKINSNQDQERSALVTQLAQATTADVVQTIGRVALLYRPREKKPTIVLPTSTKKLKRMQKQPIG